MRALEEGPHPLVDLRAQAADLALRDAGHAERLDQLVDRARRDALHVGLLDHRRQRLLGDPARLQEAREVAALPELGDAQLHRPGAGLPDPVAIAVALRQPVRRPLAIVGAGQALHLELHQALGGKADHLAQEIGVGALLQSSRRAMLSSVIVVVSGLGLLVATQPYRRSRDGHPLWIAGLPTPDSWRALRQATYPQLLHHHPGRHLARAYSKAPQIAFVATFGNGSRGPASAAPRPRSRRVTLRARRSRARSTSASSTPWRASVASVK